MATRAEIVAKLANRRLSRHYLPNLTRQLVRTAAQSLTNAEWDLIITALRNRAHQDVGVILAKRVEQSLRDAATADIESRLGANDTLSIQELEDLF